MPNLQEAFKNSLIRNDDSELLNIILNHHTKIEEYIDIYRNNFYTNLTNALTVVYPTVKKLIGEACFDYLCKLYIKNNLPKKSNLANYGSNFASYIQSIKELKHLKYLPNIAKLDYCMDNIYNSNETYKIEIREDNISYFDDFKIKNYIRLFKSKHPIDFIYKFCNSKKQQIIPTELPKKDNKCKRSVKAV